MHDRLSRVAFAKGLSVSRYVASLVDKALAEYPAERVQRLVGRATNESEPAEKYTVRLMGADAARLEERARGRSLTASGYAAHVLRAHLRAAPPDAL